MNKSSIGTIFYTPVIAATLALSQVACSDEPVNPCGVNPTIITADGECIEADGEVCDDDPCDADDFNKSDRTKKPTPKPTPKPNPFRTGRTGGSRA